MNPIIPSSLAPAPGIATAVSTPMLPSLTATPSFAVGEESPRPTRRGATNYNSLDVCAMLDIVGQILPLGANMWAEVASEYARWAQSADRPVRDQVSLKAKFDKLANKKKTPATRPAYQRCAAPNILRATSWVPVTQRAPAIATLWNACPLCQSRSCSNLRVVPTS